MDSNQRVSLRSARSVRFAIGVQPPWSGGCTCCSPRFRLRFIRHRRRSAPRPSRCFTSLCPLVQIQSRHNAKTGPPEGDPVLRGDSWTRTNGSHCASLVRSSSQSAYSRLEAASVLVAHYASASLYPPLAALGSAPQSMCFTSPAIIDSESNCNQRKNRTA